MIPATWTKPEFEIIETLCCRVRVLSLEQLRRGWWPQADTDDLVTGTMARLLDAGLLRSMVWRVKIPRLSRGPLCRWQPPMTAPNFETVTRMVRNRWPQRTCPVRVCLASSKATRLFGSSAENIPPTHHRNHDLLLGAVFVHYRAVQPAHARRWIGEDSFPLAETGVKNPDAFLINDDGEPYRVIESAGRYSRDQIETFHRYCQESELPYELW